MEEQHRIYVLSRRVSRNALNLVHFLWLMRVGRVQASGLRHSSPLPPSDDNYIKRLLTVYSSSYNTLLRRRRAARRKLSSISLARTFFSNNFNLLSGKSCLLLLHLFTGTVCQPGLSPNVGLYAHYVPTAFH